MIVIVREGIVILFFYESPSRETRILTFCEALLLDNLQGRPIALITLADCAAADLRVNLIECGGPCILAHRRRLLLLHCQCC